MTQYFQNIFQNHSKGQTVTFLFLSFLNTSCLWKWWKLQTIGNWFCYWFCLGWSYNEPTSTHNLLCGVLGHLHPNINLELGPHSPDLHRHPLAHTHVLPCGQTFLLGYLEYEEVYTPQILYDRVSEHNHMSRVVIQPSFSALLEWAWVHASSWPSGPMTTL